MTHTSTEQPELLPCPFCGGNAHFEIDTDSRWEWVECESCGMQGNSSASLMEDCKPKLREAWNRRTPSSQAQRVPLSDYKQALDFLAGLHPGITIDGPPMAVAGLIFDAVQAEQRALKEEIEKKERHLDWMRKELAKRAPKAKDCQRPECIARGCFGYCMKGITQEKQG